MSARPLACRAGRAEQRADGLAVHLPALARTELLAPLAAAVWQAADGQTGLEGLLAAARTVEPAADLNRLWLVLDVLADADLLQARLAPPGPEVDRRGWLRTLASAAAAVAVAGVTFGAGGAEAKKRKVGNDGPREEQEKATRNNAREPAGGTEDNRAARESARKENRGERRQANERRVKAEQPQRAERRQAREEQAKAQRPERAERRQVREEQAKERPNRVRESDQKTERPAEAGQRNRQGGARREALEKSNAEQANKGGVRAEPAEAQPAEAAPAETKR